MTKNSPKNTPKRKTKRAAFESAQGSAADQNQGPVNPTIHDGRRWYLIFVFVVIAIGGTYLANAMRGARNDIPRYTYEIVKKYPHDPSAFTQGLILDDGVVYESTGKEGLSTIRKVDLKTGEVLKKVKLDDRHFGEGLAKAGDKLYQLTWKKGICHVYDMELNKLKEFKYSGQGWGLTYDGEHLIMSDGTSRLRFLDPENFEEVKSVKVMAGRNRIDSLNELEYAGGFVYANRWQWDSVYKIDPETGQVEGVIDLGSIWTNRPREGMLNGIAVESFGSKSGRVLVTGKYCPTMFEIKVVPKAVN